MRGLFKLTALVIALAVVFSGGVGAQQGGDEVTAEDINLDQLVETYNANVDEAPDIARGQLAGQTIEIRVGEGDEMAKKDTGESLHVTTAESGRITDYEKGDAESPTIRIRTNEDTLEDIAQAEEPGKEFNQQYEDGDIKVGGVTMTEKVKVEAVKFAVWLGKTFGFL
jgi:hypothetical protein